MNQVLDKMMFRNTVRRGQKWAPPKKEKCDETMLTVRKLCCENRASKLKKTVVRKHEGPSILSDVLSLRGNTFAEQTKAREVNPSFSGAHVKPCIGE